MKTARVAALLLALLGAGAPAGAQQDVASIESVDHVRAELLKPLPKLTLEQRTPDFSVRIEKRRPMQDIFDIPPWQLPPLGWQPPPILGFNLLDLFSKAAGAIADAKHEHDVRVARDEVQRSIADYCATATSTAAAAICPGR